MKGQGCAILEDAILKYPDIPIAAHEFVAILQFGTNNELVMWLGHQNTLVASWLATKYADRELVKKALNRS